MTKQERFEVEISSAKIAGTCLGSGPALVFLHAGVADRRMWQPQLEAFCKTHTVVAYDRRGFGETTAIDEPFSHMGDLVAVLEHMGIDKNTLVGCSQGGRIAIDFALAYPNRVTALALIAPAVSGAPEPNAFLPEIQTLEDALDALDAADEADDLERINEIEAHMWLGGPMSAVGRVGDALRELFLDMNGIALQMPELDQEIEPESAYDHVAELNMPTLVVWGDLDFPHMRKRCRYLVGSIPRANGKGIENAAHLMSLEKAEEVNGLLRGFRV